MECAKCDSGSYSCNNCKASICGEHLRDCAKCGDRWCEECVDFVYIDESMRWQQCTYRGCEYWTCAACSVKCNIQMVCEGEDVDNQWLCTQHRIYCPYCRSLGCPACTNGGDTECEHCKHYDEEN